MEETSGYNYQELAYDLFKEGDDLLERLVELRMRRGMTEKDLAEKMNVSQGYISKIENGRTNMLSILTDYALEVGVRLHYDVSPAEEHAEGNRTYARFTETKNVVLISEWGNGDMSIDAAQKQVSYEFQSSEGLRPYSAHELTPAQEFEEDSAESSDRVFVVEHQKETANATW